MTSAAKANRRADIVDRLEAEIERLRAEKIELRALSQNNAHSWDALVKERDALRAARIAEREMIANTAREWAAHYPQSSDGRNTFILFAEWIERGAEVNIQQSSGDRGRG